MMQGYPLPYDLALLLTQLMVALAIVVLAVATKVSRKQLDQRLRTLEVLALRAAEPRSTRTVDRTMER